MAASKQASKQANIHTHVSNAVPLVWGSLRLAPITLRMVSALNVAGHRVEPASLQFSTVPQFATEVGVALQACLKDHKPGSLVYAPPSSLRNKFVKVPTQDSTLFTFSSSHFLLIGLRKERGKALDHLNT